ncbi:19412_t:CDS:1, partial [Funneliformis geosporum]
YNLDELVLNDDPNNSLNLVTKYQSVSSNDDIIPGTAFIQRPDPKLNQFSTYPTSLFFSFLQ